MSDSEDISNYIVEPGRWSFGFNGQYRHSLDEKGKPVPHPLERRGVDVQAQVNVIFRQNP